MNHSPFNQSKRYRNRILVVFTKLSLIKKLLFLLLGTGGFILIGVMVLFLLIVSGALGTLPGREELSTIKNPVASEVYSADSVLLGRYYIQERTDIRFEQLPNHVVNALLATEDIRFYKHQGIDYRSLARVLVKSILLQRDASGGGSTLTQQLAKNLYPRKDYWMFSLLINKMTEIIIATRLEEVYDKNSLLTLYLNTVSFGDNTYGIESAAQRFYNVSTQKLSIEQGAMLIGMLKATYYYNPRINPVRAKDRRNVVLAQMKKYERLTPVIADSLQALPILLNYKRITHHSGMAPYFREYIRTELLAWCREHTKTNGEPYNLYTDGLKFYTTIDSRLQHYAEVATTKQMALLQDRFQTHWAKTDLWRAQPDALNDAIRKSTRYKSLKQSGLAHEEILKEMKKPTLMTIFTWQGEKEMQMSPMDSVKHYLKFLNAGVLGHGATKRSHSCMGGWHRSSLFSI
jgi:penicillin-binding protein 1A